MKKKVIIIAIGLLLAFAVGALIYASIVKNTEQENLDKYLVDLTFNELQEKIDNSESFILLVSQTECTHCLAFKPVFKEVLAKYKITAYEIRTDTLTTEENNKFKSIANITGTPTTIFIVDGEEKSTSTRIVGESKPDAIERRLKAMGYIK